MSGAPAPGAILITGATGFLGGLVTARALAETEAPLVLPVRDPGQRDAVLARLAAECAAEGRPLRPEARARLRFEPLPPPDAAADLLPALRAHGVTDVLHCAGCLSYFNVRKLDEGNVRLTRALTGLARALDVRRFVFLSTAYSAGFTDRPIAEALHREPGSDPTDYTRTKRAAEEIVATSGVPWVIVRPSIVIGDSRDGRYGGKPYGVYQLWAAGQRFLDQVFPPVLHVVAAEAPINFVHQDAFTNGFWAAYRDLPDGAVLHLVSRDEGLPHMRALWTLWMRTYGGPREVHFYDRLADVPRDGIDEHLGLWLEFTAVNSEIASVHWRFEHRRLDALRAAGLAFPDATLAGLEACQRRFVADSPALVRFAAAYRRVGSAAPRLIPHATPTPAG